MPTKGRRAGTRTRPPRPGFPRETDLTRRVNIRDEGRSVLIVTNGKRTEVDYFNRIKEEPWVTATKVIVNFQTGEPAAVVLRTAIIRDENDYDEAWVVCDVDQYDITSAITNSKARQVELILSVPCFEVWLILHLSDACPGFNDCPQAGRHLKGLLASWDKATLRFSDFRDGVFHAVARAKRLGDPPDANPSTAVWRVVESLSARPEVEDE